MWKWHKTDSKCQTAEGRGMRTAREGAVGGDTIEAVTFHIFVPEVSVLAGCPQPTWFLLVWGPKYLEKPQAGALGSGNLEGSQSWGHDLLKKAVLIASELYCSIWLHPCLLAALFLQSWNFWFSPDWCLLWRHQLFWFLVTANSSINCLFTFTVLLTNLLLFLTCWYASPVFFSLWLFTI